MIPAYLNPRRVESAQSAFMQIIAGVVLRWPGAIVGLGVLWAVGSIAAIVWATLTFLPALSAH
jgi:hypothetical protein